MNDHFYLTLPSDSLAKYFPDNTVATFVTKLPERIRLEGNYEIGLAEIIFPHSWNNFENERGQFWLAIVGIGRHRVQRIVLPSGYYENGSILANVLNEEFKRTTADGGEELHAKFQFDELTGRFSLSVHSIGSRIFGMSDDLQRYLGLDLSVIAVDTKSYKITAQQPFDANRGRNLLYVYSDIATYSVVEDSKVPLLRICNVTGRHGDFVRQTFNHVNYVPVGRRDFETIEIRLTDEVGQPVAFQHGKSVVCLHVRRRP